VSDKHSSFSVHHHRPQPPYARHLPSHFLHPPAKTLPQPIHRRAGLGRRSADAGSDVQGPASSPKPARPSPAKPKPGRARRRA
jgi:hypothetical protein